MIPASSSPLAEYCISLHFVASTGRSHLTRKDIRYCKRYICMHSSRPASTNRACMGSRTVACPLASRLHCPFVTSPFLSARRFPADTNQHGARVTFGSRACPTAMKRKLNSPSPAESLTAGSACTGEAARKPLALSRSAGGAWRRGDWLMRGNVLRGTRDGQSSISPLRPTGCLAAWRGASIGGTSSRSTSRLLLMIGGSLASSAAMAGAEPVRARCAGALPSER